LLLREPGDRQRERKVAGVEHGLPGAHVPGRQRSCSLEVGAGEGIDARVAEAGHRTREVLVGEHASERAASGDHECLPVDREVDRLAEAWVVAEERTRRVQRKHPQRQARREKEARAVDAVLRDERERRVEEDGGKVVAPVGLFPVDALDHLVGRRHPKVDVETADMVRPVATIEAVATEREALAGAVVGDVVGPGAGRRADALGIGRKVPRHRAKERQRGPRGENRGRDG